MTNKDQRSYNNNVPNAPLAQLVEQQTLNLMVGGSTPLWRTKMFIPKKIDCKLKENRERILRKLLNVLFLYQAAFKRTQNITIL